MFTISMEGIMTANEQFGIKDCTVEDLQECLFHENIDEYSEEITEMFETGSAEFNMKGHYGKPRKFIIAIVVQEVIE